jgi:phage baseplate assembly protein W
MAIRIPNKNPLDLNKNIAIGVAIPFNHPAVFRSTFSTPDQIKSNLINYILTNKGERVFNINFGSSIRAQLFNNINYTTLSNLQTQIQGEIQANFPSITIQQLLINPDIDNNVVNLTMNYTILNSPNMETVQITM